MTKTYIEHPDHQGWRNHWIEGNYRNYLLVFSQNFIETYLPPSGIDQEFDVVLIDTEDNNKEYIIGWWVSYEEYPKEYMDVNNYQFENYNKSTKYYTLMHYIYAEKLCACNIKLGARRAGAIVENDECEGDRFKIKAIKWKDLVLYSETMDKDELEKLLKNWRKNEKN